MTVREFQCELWLPLPPDQLFPFFADAANLDAITPSWLHFRIVTPLPIAMKTGALIDSDLLTRRMVLDGGWKMNEPDFSIWGGD